MSPHYRFPRTRLPRARRRYGLHRAARPARVRLRRIALAGAVCAALTGAAAFDTGVLPVSASPSPGSGTPAGSALSGLPEKARPKDGPGTNILLVGLDRRKGLSKKTKDRLHVNGKQCDCTDVMMLLHVSADRERISIVSIPRDSWVPFAPHHDTGKGFGKDPKNPRHYGKINSAYAHGGPSLTVRTVEQNTGVRIDHYAETDFAGFVRTVDRLGGAKVCTDKPLDDANSGLHLRVGTHELNGARSLRYARARHVDPPGDLGRMRRQQRLVVEMLTSLTSDRVTGNPVALMRVARTLHDSVRTDDGFTLTKMAELGRDLRALGPRQTEFATVPLADFDHRVPTWGSTLVWDTKRAHALFADLREDRPITGDPKTSPPEGTAPVAYPPGKVPVRVVGTGKAARHIAASLRASRFNVLPATSRGPATPHEGRTEIRYDPFWWREAAALKAALPDAELRQVPPASGTPHQPVFTVRVGTEGTRVQKVVHDRSSVEGAPVNGGKLDCDTPHGDA